MSRMRQETVFETRDPPSSSASPELERQDFRDLEEGPEARSGRILLRLQKTS